MNDIFLECLLHHVERSNQKNRLFGRRLVQKYFIISINYKKREKIRSFIYFRFMEKRMISLKRACAKFLLNLSKRWFAY